MARISQPVVFYSWFNSLATELGEAGRKDEGRRISCIVLASPFAHAYPQWQQIARDLKEPNRSFVSIPSIKDEQIEIEKPVTQHVSQPATETKPEQPAEVIPFKLKEAPEPQMPDKLSPKEISELIKGLVEGDQVGEISTTALWVEFRLKYFKESDNDTVEFLETCNKGFL